MKKGEKCDGSEGGARARSRRESMRIYVSVLTREDVCVCVCVYRLVQCRREWWVRRAQEKPRV